MREKCPNTEIFLVYVLLYSVRIKENIDQKKPRSWTHFTQRRFLDLRGNLGNIKKNDEKKLFLPWKEATHPPCKILLDGISLMPAKFQLYFRKKQI